jgi:hypothetical protein
MTYITKIFERATSTVVFCFVFLGQRRLQLCISRVVFLVWSLSLATFTQWLLLLEKYARSAVRQSPVPALDGNELFANAHVHRVTSY